MGIEKPVRGKRSCRPWRFRRFTRGLALLSISGLVLWMQVQQRCMRMAMQCIEVQGEHVLTNESEGGMLVNHYTDTPIADEGKRVCDTSGEFWESSGSVSLPAPEERSDPMAMDALDLGEYSSESLRDE